MYALRNPKTGRLLAVRSESEVGTQDYWDYEGDPPAFSESWLELYDTEYDQPIFVTKEIEEIRELIDNGMCSHPSIRIDKGWGERTIDPSGLEIVKLFVIGEDPEKLK